MKGRIYKLQHPKSKVVFYVGKTILSLGERLNQHVSESKYWAADSKKCEIIAKMMAEGFSVEIELLEEMEIQNINDEKFCAAEDKWIKCLSQEFLLSNVAFNKKRVKKDYSDQQLKLIQLLSEVKTPVYKIETELGMPPTSLQKALKGKRGLPKRWSIALTNYVESKQYLLSGVIKHIPPSKREVATAVAEQVHEKKAAKYKGKETTKQTKVIPKKAPVVAQNEPKEGSMAFHLKYGAFTYAELKNK